MWCKCRWLFSSTEEAETFWSIYPPKRQEVLLCTCNNRKCRHIATFFGMKTNYGNQFQEFRVRRICPVTGKLLEMPILMIRRHFLLAHQAFQNHKGDRTLIPYLTESEYRFLFEGVSPKK